MGLHHLVGDRTVHGCSVLSFDQQEKMKLAKMTHPNLIWDKCCHLTLLYVWYRLIATYNFSVMKTNC